MYRNKASSRYISNKLPKQPLFWFMSSEKEILRKRELEVQRLMRQMKFDDLQRSQVYRNLEQELQKIQQNLDSKAEQKDFSNTNALVANGQSK